MLQKLWTIKKSIRSLNAPFRKSRMVFVLEKFKVNAVSVLSKGNTLLVHIYFNIRSNSFSPLLNHRYYDEFHV